MDWSEFLKQEAQQDYYKKIVEFIKSDSKIFTIFPAHKDLFNAFEYTPFDQVRVCLLGMDPYINNNQAHGLAFSVQKRIDKPPSLVNIFKELKSDLNIDPPAHGCLEAWAKQGVLLLNTSLTVRKGESGSHSKIGWEILTDKAIQLLNDKTSPIVFILWGNYARKKKSLITNSIHLVLEASHPSPLSAHQSFFGSKPFSKTNDFLSKNNLPTVDWKIL